MTVRSEIIAKFTVVAIENDRKLARLTDDLELLESGPDSFCFAVLVARLRSHLEWTHSVLLKTLCFP